MSKNIWTWSCKISSAPVLAPGDSKQGWVPKPSRVLKKTILTDIDMLLMEEKGIRGGVCHSTYQYANCNNK